MTVGDLVELKSGGPIMTIDAFGKGEQRSLVWCSWFSGDTRNRDHFQRETLRPYQEETDER